MIGRVKALASLLLTAGLLAAACGSGGATAPTSADGVTAITVGTSPTLSNAALYYADGEGMFKRNKLEVTLSPLQSGAAAVPLLLNGQLAVAASDPVAAIVSVSKNVPVTIVAPGNVSPTDPAMDSTALLVKADGPVKSVRDLDGKTVAVNALNSLSHISVKRAIDKNGGDSSKVKFVELPLPQMVDAVARGQVDGAVENEPYTTQGLESGLRRLVSPLTEALPGVPQLVYLSAKPYVQKNAATIDRFAAALTEANRYLGANPETARAIGRTSTQTPPEVLEKILVPVYNDKPVDRRSLTTLMDLMVRYGVISAPIDLNSVISEP
ncbi:NitT/TauT family transport system substrate-binding protein [Thermocatellispora tengchongensis]|uniref:NitT/TauT family transport system substrate-binding protein n=1 Tax=Thermocatellispora tengchongensis TaxID=1073253 RepID=A0A840PQ12_9ACTN|nr:ABC transporter substrate-binding protein [Thermocatellispora tengchongensis]MBB5139830.1 NitT/TauT family transport system substrate-binding protein [Thermocatellispora tengchongensis]